MKKETRKRLEFVRDCLKEHSKAATESWCEVERLEQAAMLLFVYAGRMGAAAQILGEVLKDEEDNDGVVHTEATK